MAFKDSIGCAKRRALTSRKQSNASLLLRFFFITLVLIIHARLNAAADKLPVIGLSDRPRDIASISPDNKGDLGFHPALLTP
jgi:hypothetical protein